MLRFDLERDILHQSRDYLRWKGFFVVRIQQGLGCHRGVSDLVALKNGKTIWVEIKTPRGKLSDQQFKFKEEVERHGGCFWVIRSLDELSAKIAGVADREKEMP